MPHWRTLLDPGDFLGPQDFDQPTIVTIARLSSEASDKEDPKKCPMMYFQHNGKELHRKFKVPKSVMYGLSLLLGTDYTAWTGKEITLERAVCMCWGEREECIRVQFPAPIEARIVKWLKKRKASPSVYRIQDQGDNK